MPPYDPNGEFDPHNRQQYRNANGQHRRERLPDSYATPQQYTESRRDSIHHPHYHQSQFGRGYSARPRAFAETTSPRQLTAQNVGHSSQQVTYGYGGYNNGNQSWTQPNQSFQSIQPFHQRQVSYEPPNQPYPSLQAPQTSRPPLLISYAESNEDSPSVQRHGEANANDLQFEGHLSSHGQAFNRGEGPALVGTYIPSDAGNIYERLDPSYFVRHRNFFQIGRVVAVIMSENLGATATSYNSCISMVRFRDHYIHTQVRRFVVVQVKGGFCYACPIFTYSKRGTTKPGVVSREHGIAYSYGYNPERLPNENGVMKPSLPVIMADGEPALHVASRIYYGIHHPIQFNVKVKEVGQVPQNHLHTLNGNFQSENHGPGTRQSADITAAAELPEIEDLHPRNDGSDPHWYHVDNNKHGYDQELCPNNYHPKFNPYGYHPKMNVEGYHPEYNPHGYHLGKNPYGYHSKHNPYCWHPVSNPSGYHQNNNPTGYHNITNPGGAFPRGNFAFHPDVNPYGYHYMLNPDGFHPKYTPYCFHQIFNDWGYHQQLKPKVYHDKHNPHGEFPNQSTFPYALPFHPVENIYGYHYKHSPRGYSPMFTPFYYHPNFNPQGYHSEVNPHGYHYEENIHGFHPTHNPNGFHTILNPAGYHPEYNMHAFHPTYNPSGYHPSANPFGFDPTQNASAFHPQHNADGDRPSYPQAEPEPEIDQLANTLRSATI